MNQDGNSPIVGIDLGTTNSVVAGIVDGKVVILAGDAEQQILPSVVDLDASGKMITACAIGLPESLASLSSEP